MIVNKEAIVPNSFSVPSIASFVIKVNSKKEVAEANDFAKKEGLSLFVVGEGTNIVPHNYIKAVVAVLDFKDIKINNNHLNAEAGEKWDDVVKFAVKNSLVGIEALSAIPGKAGAAPVQNIGAYGSEIADRLESVEVYDRTKKEFATINNKECQFGYRNSLFKKHPEKFIIVSINLKLSKGKPKMPDYKDVENYFSEKNSDFPTLEEIRDAIMEIRKRKLPDPMIFPNAGSYFINPVVENKKISASRLIDQTGLRGKRVGKIEISPNNALILTNPDKAGFEEIMEAENFIRQKVFQKFGIMLEREPLIMG